MECTRLLRNAKRLRSASGPADTQYANRSMNPVIFLTVSATRAVVAHLLLRTFWFAVAVSALIVSGIFFSYVTSRGGPVEPFDNLAAIFAGIYGGGISSVVGVAVRLLRRSDASDGEHRSRLNGR